MREQTMNSRNHSESNETIAVAHGCVKRGTEYVRRLVEALSEFNAEEAAAFDSTLAAYHSNEEGGGMDAIDQTDARSLGFSEAKSEFDSKLVSAKTKLQSKVTEWLHLSQQSDPAPLVSYSMVEELNAAMGVLGVKSTDLATSSSINCTEIASVDGYDDHNVSKLSDIESGMSEESEVARNDKDSNVEAEEKDSTEEEVILKEPVALYKNSNGWVNLDTKKSRSTLQLYKHKVTQKVRMVVGSKGTVRVHCYVSKDMSFMKPRENIIQFAVRVGDEREDTKFQSFALKVDASRVDEILSTLKSVGNGDEAVVENKIDTVGCATIEKGGDVAQFHNEGTGEEVVLESMRAQLIKITDGKFDRLTLKKGLVIIYHSQRSGHRMVYRNSTDAIKFESPVVALTMVEMAGSYVKFTKSDTDESYMLKLSESNARKLAATLAVILSRSGCNLLGPQRQRSCLFNTEEDDDESVGSFSTVGEDDDEEILYKVRARPVQVLQGSPDEECFFAMPDEGLFTKQLDEGILELRRKSSGEQRMVWFIENDFDGDLVIDIFKGIHIEVVRYDVKTNDLPPFGLRLIKIIARENLTRGVYMFRVSSRKVDKLYGELKKMIA